MSRHLPDVVLLEMAETASAHPHLETCPRCRTRFDDVRTALRLAAGAEVPEPSPLFWDRFSANVRDAVARDADPRPVAGWRAVALRPAFVAGLIVLVAASVMLWHSGGGRAPQAESIGVRHAQPAVIAVPLAAAGEPGADEDGLEASWGLVTGAAADVDLDTAAQAGFVLSPGAADQAVAQLSPDEQRELVQALQDALDGPQ